MNRLDIAQSFCNLCNFLQVFFIIIDSGYQRTTQNNFGSGIVKFLQILQNKSIVHTGQSTVQFAICGLDVIEKNIGIFTELFQIFKFAITAAFDTAVYALLLCQTHNFQSKFRLKQRLSTGNGQTAAALVEKYPVFFDLGNDLRRRHIHSGDRQGPDRTICSQSQFCVQWISDRKSAAQLLTTAAAKTMFTII